MGGITRGCVLSCLPTIPSSAELRCPGGYCLKNVLCFGDLPFHASPLGASVDNISNRLLSLWFSGCAWSSLQHAGSRGAGSVVVVQKHGCPMACMILVPQPGIEPISPALGVQSLNHLTKFNREVLLSSIQFSSVAQLCPTLCNPINRSTPGLPVHHQLPEFTQTHVHQVGDAIQPSHPLSSPSTPAPNHSQHQGLFQ